MLYTRGDYREINLSVFELEMRLLIMNFLNCVFEQEKIKTQIQYLWSRKKFISWQPWEGYWYFGY